MNGILCTMMIFPDGQHPTPCTNAAAHWVRLQGVEGWLALCDEHTERARNDEDLTVIGIKPINAPPKEENS